MFSGTTRPTTSPRIGLNLTVMALAVPAIFCTVALPAYAARNPSSDAAAASAAAGDATAQLEQLKTSDAQTVSVAADAPVAATGRDAFSATSEAELKRAQLRAAMLAYRGPSVRALLANPPYPNFSLDQVVAVAKQYIGVPYVYGGASPAGFDCSGFTSYVYRQAGISLPRTAAAQQAASTKVSNPAPGDLIFFGYPAYHVGIYAGGGMMYDSPRTGKTTGLHAIWTQSGVSYGRF